MRLPYVPYPSLAFGLAGMLGFLIGLEREMASRDSFSIGGRGLFRSLATPFALITAVGLGAIFVSYGFLPGSG